MKFTTAFGLIASAQSAIALAVPGQEVTDAEVSAARASIYKRACYGGGGEIWGTDQPTAVEYVLDLCKSGSRPIGSSGQQLGELSYTAGQEKAICRNLNSGKRVDFVVKNTSGVTKFLSFDECWKGLSYEIWTCTEGGVSGYPALGWSYRSDPNTGRCN
ncbi:hypothetical protein QBC35DRAFT_476327 [Podospora australis]|uniref:Uncharacterized protein n=1 Tax=Podospora australis TaxID=1536484 RepID=A0AAN6WPP8_9PEZI|nr:hypothetical protein QBC35DRAFT_476327 [Podospora australis]